MIKIQQNKKDTSITNNYNNISFLFNFCVVIRIGFKHFSFFFRGLMQNKTGLNR